MDIVCTPSSLFAIVADAIIVPVNCVGVMGKGLALQVKRRYPENYNKYQIACYSNLCMIGKCFITVERSGLTIINFPTKDHWRFNSEYHYVKLGLADMVKQLNEKPEIKSVAIPPLGCGAGNLDYGKIKPMIQEAAQDLKYIDTLFLCSPH